MNIRLAIPSELGAVDAMVKELYPDDPYNASSFAKAFKHNATWVAEDNGKWAAHLVSEIDAGAPYIWSVATYPAYRGKGLATALIHEFEKHYIALGYDRSWLHTKVENPAQKLYFDLGYRVASFVPHIYGLGRHGLTMRKQLV